MGYIGKPTLDSQNAANFFEIIAIAGQTTFVCKYTLGMVDVHLNGVLLSKTDYIATSGTSIVLNTPALLNDIITIEAKESMGFLGGTYTEGQIDTLLSEKTSLSHPAISGNFNNVTIDGQAISKHGGKNYIINGGFDYWNYATSQTSSGYGSDDRWGNGNLGSTKTHLMVNATDTERALFNSSKFSRTVVTSVTGVSNYCWKAQAIENVTKLASKTVTISFWAKADSSKNIAISLLQVFGTGGSPSTAVDAIGAQLISLTSTWQKKTITVTIPSIVGKTLGTDGVHTSATYIHIAFDAGSNWNARTASLGQQSGTFDIAEVKLEEGSVATPWTPYEGEFGGEVQACQRYYENSGTNLAGYVSSHTPLNTAGDMPGFRFATTKRVPPTVTLFHGVNGTINQVYRITDGVAIGVTSVSHIGTKGVGSFIIASGSANGYIFNYTASAEL